MLAVCSDASDCCALCRGCESLHSRLPYRRRCRGLRMLQRYGAPVRGSREPYARMNALPLLQGLWSDGGGR